MGTRPCKATVLEAQRPGHCTVLVHANSISLRILVAPINRNISQERDYAENVERIKAAADGEDSSRR